MTTTTVTGVVDALYKMLMIFIIFVSTWYSNSKTTVWRLCDWFQCSLHQARTRGYINRHGWCPVFSWQWHCRSFTPNYAPRGPALVYGRHLDRYHKTNRQQIRHMISALVVFNSQSAFYFRVLVDPSDNSFNILRHNANKESMLCHLLVKRLQTPTYPTKRKLVDWSL